MPSRILAFLLLLASASASAAGLDLRIRPQLPPDVTTVGDAARYYLEPTGYSFIAATPATGDARELASFPAKRPPANAQVVTVEQALLALLPPGTDLFIDDDAKAVAIGESK